LEERQHWQLATNQQNPQAAVDLMQKHMITNKIAAIFRMDTHPYVHINLFVSQVYIIRR
jgi:hypothetical protein